MDQINGFNFQFFIKWQAYLYSILRRKTQWKRLSKNRCMTLKSSKVSSKINSVKLNDPKVASQTIWNYLKGIEIIKVVTNMIPVITKASMVKRLPWCKENIRRNWNVNTYVILAIYTHNTNHPLSYLTWIYVGPSENKRLNYNSYCLTTHNIMPVNVTKNYESNHILRLNKWKICFPCHLKQI